MWTGGRGRWRGAGAFTLIEVAVSLSVMGVLVVAIGSVLALTFKAVPNAGHVSEATIAEAGATDRMSEELATATAFAGGTDKAVQFMVPDRDKDGNAETVRYEWSGKPGDSLLRTYNAGTPAVLADGVRAMTLAYLITNGTETQITAPVTGAEAALVTQTPASTTTYNVTSSDWAAEYFKPTLPVGAVSWSVSKIRLYGQRSLVLDGTSAVEVCLADASGLPTSTVVASTSVNESSFGASLGPVDLPITPVTGLSPSQGLCVVVRRTAGIVSVTLGLSATAGQALAHAVTTANGGGTWIAVPTSTYLCVIYGTSTVQGTNVVAHKFLERIDVSLTLSSDSAAPVKSSVRIVARPEVN